MGDIVFKIGWSRDGDELVSMVPMDDSALYARREITITFA